MTPDRLLRWLLSFPFPGAVSAMQGGDLVITLEGEVLRFDGAWRAPDGQRIPHTFPEVPNADDIHAEIRRGLAIARGITGASWEQTKEDCVGPELPRPLDLNAECARVHAESERLQDRLTDVEAQLAKMTDAHAVVSQRLIGAQKEIGEVTVERDREHAAHNYAQGLLNAVWAAVGWPAAPYELDGVPHVQRVVSERDAAVGALRRDDALRSEIAVAVGLDGSASLALILDTVARDRPGREISGLSGLLDVLAAPVTFGGRRLSTAERAEWALRRWLAEGKECSARMAQLIEAEVYLDVLGVPAYAAVPSDDPGDASEALTLPERLRLHFASR